MRASSVANFAPRVRGIRPWTCSRAPAFPRLPTRIRYWKEADFQEVEKQLPGTLVNNCGFDLWQKRYVDRDLETSKAYPWKGQKILSEPLSSCVENRERHVSRWAFQFSFQGRLGKLLGCTEDIRCLACPEGHAVECETPPFCRKLCPQCEVPVCHDCSGKLRDHNAESSFLDGGTIPMSISNDHYYGFVNRFLVENQVTWLECAACS